MNIKKCGLLWAMALMLGFASCAKNDIIDAPIAQNKTIEYTGDEVNLNLEAQLEEEDLRGAVYNYQISLKPGRAPKLILPETVPVRVYVRKKGQINETISTVILDGKVTEEGSKYHIRINGKLRLRKEGQNLRIGEWQVLCAIGGKALTANPQNDTEGQPGSPNNATYLHVAHQITPTINGDPLPYTQTYHGQVTAIEDTAESFLSSMPWMTDWSPLEAIEDQSADGSGRNLQLLFKPKGVLLRIKPRSNMIAPMKLTRMRIECTESDVLFFGGEFDMLTDHENIPNQPKFLPAYNTPIASHNYAPVRKAILLDLTDEPLLPSGAEMDRTFYVWVMPAQPVGVQAPNPLIDIQLEGYVVESRPENIFSSDRLNDLYLGVSVTDPNKGEHSKNNRDDKFKVVYKTRHKVSNYVSGHAYTLYPILSSELMISEVLVRPAEVPESNPEYSNPDAYPLGTIREPNYNAVWGAVELYNPTLSDIKLADYGLIRIKAMKWERNSSEYYLFHAHPSNGTLGLDHAIVQPLTFTPNEASKTMAGAEDASYKTTVRLVHGSTVTLSATTTLPPHKTFIVLDASYARNRRTLTQRINQGNVHSIGTQIDQAVKKGYCLAAVSLDNGKNKTTQTIDWRSDDAPVMAAGPQDSYILVKKNAKGGYDKVDVGGNNPEESTDIYTTTDAGKRLATYWSGHSTTLGVARHGRDGNVRTRFVPVMRPKKDSPDYDEWGFTPSVERGSDYVNKFATLGTRRWYGPTEGSRLSEWASVPNFTAPAPRQWTITRPTTTP